MVDREMDNYVLERHTYFVKLYLPLSNNMFILYLWHEINISGNQLVFEY